MTLKGKDIIHQIMMVIKNCFYKVYSLEEKPNSLYSSHNSFPPLLSNSPKKSQKHLENLSWTVRGEAGWMVSHH